MVNNFVTYGLDKDSITLGPITSSIVYKSNDDIASGIYIDTNDDRRFNFTVEGMADIESGASCIRLNTHNSTEAIRLHLSFPLNNFSVGEVVDIAWTTRLQGSDGTSQAPGKLPVSILVCSKDKQQKVPASASQLKFDVNAYWTTHHLVSQLQRHDRQQSIALSIDVPPSVIVDVSDMFVVKVGKKKVSATSKNTIRTIGRIFSIRTPAAASRPEGEVYGFFELDKQKLSLQGFAWNLNSAEEATALVLAIDDVFLAQTSTLYNDTKSLFAEGAPGRFRYDLDENIRDGVPHTFAVHSLAGNVKLIGDDEDVIFEKSEDGNFSVTPEGEITGWAVDHLTSPMPATVDISIDANHVLTTKASSIHPNLKGKIYNNSECAFKAAIPLKYLDGESHTLTVNLENSKRRIGDVQVFRLQRGRYSLKMNVNASRKLRCMITDDAQSPEPPKLKVLVDGEDIGHFEAGNANAGILEEGHFYKVQLPIDAKAVHISTSKHGSLARFEIIAGAIDNIHSSQANSNQDGEMSISSLMKEFFDEEWYNLRHPSAYSEMVDHDMPLYLSHWQEIGSKQDLDPAPWFDERWFLHTYEDARTSKATGKSFGAFDFWLEQASRGDWRRVNVNVDPLSLRRSESDGPLDAIRYWLASSDPSQNLRDMSSAQPIEAEVVKQRPAGKPSRIYDDYLSRVILDVERDGGPSTSGFREALGKNEEAVAEIIASAKINEGALVSIIMPTFNRGYLIAEAIQSVLDQTYCSFELIICDDGSTDRTGYVVSEFTDTRIRYLKLEKANGAVARNYGIRFAKGEYFAFLDSDNLWHPDYLRLSLAALASRFSMMSYTGYIDALISKARFSDVELKFNKFDYQRLLHRNYIDLNSIVVRRVVVDNLGSFDETLERVQDWDLLLRYCQVVEPVSVDAYAVLYRRNTAWSQVTQLQAHSKFRSLVANRALTQLERRTSVLKKSLARDAIVTIAVEKGSNNLNEMLSLASMLARDADVTLILHSDDVASLDTRSVDSGVTLRAASNQPDYEHHAVGEIIILSDERLRSSFEMLHDIPMMFFDASIDGAKLYDAYSASKGSFVGHLSKYDRRQNPESNVARAEHTLLRLLVLADNSDGRVWLDYLKRHDLDVEFAVANLAIEGRRPMIEVFDAESAYQMPAFLAIEQLAELARGYDGVLLLSSDGRFSSQRLAVCLTALSSGVPIFSTRSAISDRWAESGAIQVMDAEKPSAIIKFIESMKGQDEVLNRSIRRGRYIFLRDYEPHVVQDRISLLLEAVM